MSVRSAASAGSRRSRVRAAKNPANPPPTTTTDGRDAAGTVMRTPGATKEGGRVPAALRAARRRPAPGDARRSLDDERPVHLRVDAAVEGVAAGLGRRGEG